MKFVLKVSQIDETAPGSPSDRAAIYLEQLLVPVNLRNNWLREIKNGPLIIIKVVIYRSVEKILKFGVAA